MTQAGGRGALSWSSALALIGRLIRNGGVIGLNNDSYRHKDGDPWASGSQPQGALPQVQ
jgi:hypothetical protein